MMHHRSICVRLLWASGLTSLLAGCGAVDPRGSSLDGEDEQIMSNLLEAGFDGEAIEVTEDGEVVVEGDIVMSLSASQALAGNGFRHYRTTNTVADTFETIKVWISPQLKNHPGFALAVESALEEWNGIDKNLQFRFVSVYSNSPPNHDSSEQIAVIEVSATQSTTFAALTDFPSNSGRPGRSIRINASRLCRADTKHVLMHEIGHALGLRHTDYGDHSSCPTPFDEGADDDGGGDGAIHIDDTPLVDPHSVMNACIGEKRGKWSQGDRDAIIDLYGPVI